MPAGSVLAAPPPRVITLTHTLTLTLNPNPITLTLALTRTRYGWPAEEQIVAALTKYKEDNKLE